MNKEMVSSRKSAMIVGILFILATLAGVLSGVIGGTTTDPDFFVNISDNENGVMIGALLVLVMAIAIAFIPIAIYPILKKYNESLALGYIVLRTIEVILFTTVVVILLSLVTLNQEFILAGSPDDSYFQTLSTTLIDGIEWAEGVCSTIFFGLSALILYYVLYQSKFIPRWLSGWGIIGAILYFAAGFLPLFGHDSRSTVFILLNVPLGVNEMVFGVWLVIKGFNIPEIESGSTT